MNNFLGVIKQRRDLMLAVLGGALAILPPVIVMSDRWFRPVDNIQQLNNLLVLNPENSGLWIPAYYWLNLVCFIGLVALVAWKYPHPPRIEGTSPTEELVGDANTPHSQYVVGNVLRILVLLTALLSAIFGILHIRQPGVECLFLALIYVVGLWLPGADFRKVFQHVWWARNSILAVIVVQITLVLLLRAAALQDVHWWLYALLFGLSAFGAVRCRLNPVLWIFFLAQALFTMQIQSWKYAIVGDEYAFFTYAAELLRTPLSVVLANMAQCCGVFRAHAVFSSVLMALVMRLVGIDNFGWRFSSIFTSALSIPVFFIFFRTYLKQKMALFAVLLLVFSNYLLSFSKIGYNNLQALLVEAILLAAVSQALRKRSPFFFGLIGITQGLCLYVFPAALYLIPLPFLLFWLERKKLPPKTSTWLFPMGAGAFLFVLPLAFQLDFWQMKFSGTILNNAGLYQPILLWQHLVDNFLYSLLSFEYLPRETHFVVSSYLDPLSIALLPVGLGLVLYRLKTNQFARFMLLAGFYLLIVVGTTHDYLTPPTTRMFLLLPFWCWLAAEGLEGVVSWLSTITGSLVIGKISTILLLLTILAGGLYLTGILSYQRSPHLWKTETLFLRLGQYHQEKGSANLGTYVFVHEKSWPMWPFQTMQQVYGVPSRSEQIEDLPLADSTSLSAAQVMEHLVEGKVIPVFDSRYLSLQSQQALAMLMLQSGKKLCAVRETPAMPSQFYMWLAPGKVSLCPWGGNWD